MCVCVCVCVFSLIRMYVYVFTQSLYYDETQFLNSEDLYSLTWLYIYIYIYIKASKMVLDATLLNTQHYKV